MGREGAEPWQLDLSLVSPGEGHFSLALSLWLKPREVGKRRQEGAA